MMICALPCIRFTVEEREIAQKSGFLTFPQFLDNHYIKEGKAQVKWLERNLRRFGMGQVVFAIAPDFQYEEMKRLKKEYPHINWVFPFHDRSEDFSDFEWVGFPYKDERRNYGLDYFLKVTEDHKRWLLGFWDQSNPSVLRFFDGFDTTIPEYYSGKTGRIWLDWGKTEPVSHLNLSTIEIFQFNVISFKIALLKLFERWKKETSLCQVKLDSLL